MQMSKRTIPLIVEVIAEDDLSTDEVSNLLNRVLNAGLETAGNRSEAGETLDGRDPNQVLNLVICSPMTFVEWKNK